jgi:predicted protein tyrosine phosphatase
MMPRSASRLLAIPLTATLILTSGPARGQTKKPPPIYSECGWLLETFNDRNYDPLKSFTYSTPPAEEVQSFATAPQAAKSELFIVAPTSEEEIKAIYGVKDVSTQDSAQLPLIAASMKKSLRRSDPDRDLTRENFESRIVASSAPFIFLVGHNDRGQFRFANGKSGDLMSLTEAAMRHGKRLIVISCKTSDHLTSEASVGTQRDLTYPEAFEITRRMQAHLASLPSASLASLKANLEKTETAVHRKSEVKYYVVHACHGIAGIAAIALIISLLDDDDKKKHHATDAKKKG